MSMRSVAGALAIATWVFVASCGAAGPPPTAFLERVEIPHCGLEITEDPFGPVMTPEEVARMFPYAADPNAAARSCFEQADASGRPAELQTVSMTVEGDPFFQTIRRRPDETYEVFDDLSYDSHFSGGWTFRTCAVRQPHQLPRECGDQVVLGDASG